MQCLTHSCAGVAHRLPRSAAACSRAQTSLPTSGARIHSSLSPAALRLAPVRLLSATSTHLPSGAPAPLAFAFDIDGVLLRGNTPLPNAIASLTALNSAGTPWVLLTNGGGLPEKEKAEQLSTILTLPVLESQVILSHTPMRPLIADKYTSSKVLILGCKDVPGVAASCGAARAYTSQEVVASDPSKPYPFVSYPKPHPSRYCDPAEPFTAVLILHDPVEWGQDIQVAVDALRGGPGGTQRIPVYATNADITFAGVHAHPRLAAGSFLIALKAVWEKVEGTPLHVEMYGKPTRHTFKYAATALAHRYAQLHGGPPPPSFARIVMVGDNPHADIRGANAAGPPWVSALVRTGVFKGAVPPSGSDAPTVVMPGVGEAVRWGRGLD